MRRPRKRTLARLGAGLSVLLLLGAAAGLRSHWEVTHTRLETVTIDSPRVAGPLRILQVTDVHDMPDAGQRAAIVELARTQHPDLVAITGDLESVFTTNLARMDDFTGRLAALGVPTYFIPGNHENDNTHPGCTTADVVAMLQRHGITTLVNRHVTQDGPWGRLDVIGTDDYYTHRGDLTAAMHGTRDDAFHLVLTHSPQAHDALAASSADLVLSGHTHGGQVRVPGLGALYSPGSGFLPRYDKGLFAVGRGWLYVDSGAGASLPLRLNDQSEVTLLVVRPRS